MINISNYNLKLNVDDARWLKIEIRRKLMFTKNELVVLEVILNDDCIMELGERTLLHIRDNVELYGESKLEFFEHYDNLNNFTYLLYEKVYDSLYSENDIEFTEVDEFVIHVLLSQFKIENLPLMMITTLIDKDISLQQMIDIDTVIQSESLESSFESIKSKVDKFIVNGE